MINKVRSTHKELISKYSRLTTKALGFTMAEILLSLTIIGVVAAITLPSLTGNINERTWNTQRRALFARFSQAIALMPALNGYGTLDDTDSHKVSETFVTTGLSKVLKINNICSENLQDCGFPAQMADANGTKMTTPKKVSELYNPYDVQIHLSDGSMMLDFVDVNAVALETANGESLLAFYNPKCTAKNVLHGSHLIVPEKICVNFLYDLNGKKGPNTFGKDIGIISAFYPTDSVVVAPMPFLRGGEEAVDFFGANSYCKTLDNEYRSPNLEEMMALMYNHDIVKLGRDKYWTNTRDGNKAWLVSLTNRVWKASVSESSYATNNYNVRCIQR